jgi:hypothetical protein
MLRASWANALRQAALMLVIVAGLACLVGLMAPRVVDGLALGPSFAALLPLVLVAGVVFSLVGAVRRIVGAARGELRVASGTIELERPGRPPLVIRTAETTRLQVERPVPTARGMRWPLGGIPTSLAVAVRAGSATAKSLARFPARDGVRLVDLAGYDPGAVEEALSGAGGPRPEAPRVAGRTVEG